MNDGVNSNHKLLSAELIQQFKLTFVKRSAKLEQLNAGDGMNSTLDNVGCMNSCEVELAATSLSTMRVGNVPTSSRIGDSSK